MSLVTISPKRPGRIYHRMFDHDECRALRAEDPKRWSYRALAEHYGVSPRAIERLFNPKSNARLQANSLRCARRARRPCVAGCGRLVWHQNRSRTGMCPECVGKARAADRVRPYELQCADCKQWKPDEEFYRKTNVKARRGRTTDCKTCSNARRRAYRAANREREARYSNDYRRIKRERKRMSAYIVFQPNGHGFVEVGRVDAGSPAHAIEKTAKEPGEYIAVPAGKFRVMRVEPVQRLTVVSE